MQSLALGARIQLNVFVAKHSLHARGGLRAWFSRRAGSGRPPSPRDCPQGVYHHRSARAKRVRWNDLLGGLSALTSVSISNKQTHGPFWPSPQTTYQTPGIKRYRVFSANSLYPASSVSSIRSSSTVRRMIKRADTPPGMSANQLPSITDVPNSAHIIPI